MKIHKACIRVPNIVRFRLDVPKDKSKIQTALSKLGLGGVPWDLVENFIMSSPVPDPEDMTALLARMYKVGRLYQSTHMGNVHTILSLI